MQLIIKLVFSSFLLSLIMNYAFNQFFLKRKKIDQINMRSSHSVVATKSGGVAIFTCLSIITVFLYSTNNEIFDFSILLPLGIIFFVGVYDDFYDADFKLKFFLQIIVAKLLIDQGYLINNFHGLFGFYEIPNLVAQFATVFAFLIIVNSINFSDGIDGLAATLIIYFIIIFEFFMSFESKLIYLNIILVLLILPYFLFNSKKNNKVFLGDAGSLFLGAIVAINVFNFLSIKNSNEVYYNPAVLTITILIYPLLDLLRVFFFRISKGISPFFADKNHIHHQLLKSIKNHYLINLVIFLFCVIFLIIILLIEYYTITIFSILTLFALVTFALYKKL